MTSGSFSAIILLMNLIDGFKTLIVSILATVTTTVAPVTKDVLPVNHVNQTATPSSELRRVSPSPTVFTPVSKPTAKVGADNRKVEPAAESMIRAEDSYDYMGQKATFYIDIPKKGGKISGKITGLCNGTVTGDFNGQTSTETVDSGRHDIIGEAKGTCHVGFIPVPASAKFYGQVLLSHPFKRVVLTVDIEKPIQTRAYPVMRIW